MVREPREETGNSGGRSGEPQAARQIETDKDRRIRELEVRVAEREAEHAAAQAALRESEARCRSLVDLAPDAVLVHRDRKIVFANAAALRLYRADSFEQLAGKDILDLIHPDDREISARRAEAAQAGERIVPRELRLLAFDGKQVSAEARGVGIHYQGRAAVQVIIRDITERKRAEQALRVREARYRGLFDNTSDGIWITTLEGQIREVNEAYCVMSGYSRDEIVGMPISRLEAVESPDAVAAHIRKIVESGGHDRFESKHRRRDGSIIDVDITALYLEGEGHLAVVARDITARKQNEKALQDAKEQLEQRVLERTSELTRAMGALDAQRRRFHDVLEHLPAYVILLNRDYRVPLANRYFEERFGKAEGRRCYEYLFQRTTPCENCETFKVFETHVPHHWQWMGPDGRDYDIHDFEFTDVDGSPMVLEMGIDVTEMKRAEAAVQRERRRLYDVLEALPAMICLLTPDYRVAFGNRSFRERFGEPRGRHCYEQCFGRAASCEFCETYSVLQSGKSHRWEVTGPDGQSIFEAYDFPFTDVDGSPLILEMNIDITERKRTEAALRELNETLEQRVAERTSELSRANQQLEEADRRKNEFLAMLSHELRNPLAPISNCLHILDRAAPGGDQAKRAKEVIGRQVAHLSHLVNDLLDVTRISRNKIQLQRQRADLCDIVRRSVEDQRSLFERSGIKLDLEIPAEPILVHVDPTRVAQMVGNLLQNAAKFTRRGGRTHVRVAADRPRGLAIIRVADTGVGMTPETIAGLFQPFVQADRTLDRSAGGLGLGLALVKGLVELHGGEVCAHSDGPGKGAELVLTLPLGEVAADRTGTSPAAIEQRSRRVLVIEDNIDAADSLRDVLELCGHQVDVANNGPDGIACAQAARPEVVLCDIGLPGMDGYAVARAIRADPALSGLYLVALSGYALPEDLLRATEAGFDGHLAKPPSIEKLEQLIAEAPQNTVRLGPARPG